MPPTVSASDVYKRQDQDGAETKAVFSALARSLRTNIIPGSVTNLRNGKLYNTAMVFDREGACIASYDKTHLFSPMGEDQVYEKGASLCRFQLDGANCGLIICYDLRFPELIRSLTLPGLDVLFIVSQWPAVRCMHLSTLARARAIENQMFVALCNSCGKAGATVYGGCSTIIDPWGEPCATAGDTPCTVTAQADLRLLADIRDTIPVFRDRRPDLYTID